MSALSIAVWRYDRTQALFDGRVKVEGHAAEFQDGPLEDIFSRAFDHGAFDASELSFSNFLRTTATGECRYVGLPVFPSRSFRHGAFYIRTDGSVRGPEDLIGRRIGVREYSMTAALAARGALRDHFSVEPTRMSWVVGDVDYKERDTIPLPRLYKDVDVTRAPEGRFLSEMLLAKEIDAILAYKPIKPFVKGDPRVQRLFPDYPRVERDYFAAHHTFPIMHLMGLRNDHAARDPALGVAIQEAFAEAHALAMEDLMAVQALKVALPWLPQAVEQTVAAMGPDFWPTGFSANAGVMETMIRWSHEDGLIAAPLPPEALFLPALCT